MYDIILFILVWFTPMPIWLKILSTLGMTITIIIDIIKMRGE